MNIDTQKLRQSLLPVQNADNTENSPISQDISTNDSTGETSGDFASLMRQILGIDAGAQVNEEELFASLLQNRLGHHSEEASNFFRQQKDQLMVSMRRADGYVSVEDVANASLKATVDAGKIDSDTASVVNAEAFRAAQLDDNASALYDGQGSEGDATIALAEMESALLKMSAVIDQIDNGELDVGSRNFNTPSNSALNDSTSGEHTNLSGATELDGSGGFLWKPVSESNDKLVVLLPTDLKGLIDRVEIHSSLPPDETTKLAEGRFAGDTHNGGRPHFRFDKAGGDYGDDLQLVIFKDDGDTVSYAIQDGSKRHD